MEDLVGARHSAKLSILLLLSDFILKVTLWPLGTVFIPILHTRKSKKGK